MGREICNAKVAVVGLGAVGSQFARFAVALGARVFGYDPAALGDGVALPNFYRVELEEALRGADVVSLHAPLPADGLSLLAHDELAYLARGAVVVNTARAGLVDPTAMLAALNNGQVGAYATDVFETEPPSIDDLLSHSNVLLTSHIGGYTAESVERTTEVAVANLLEVLEGHAHRAC
jgi:phosphoglycerate dehydrogenase-like enzyme